jgi:hypothetical protein
MALCIQNVMTLNSSWLMDSRVYKWVLLALFWAFAQMGLAQNVVFFGNDLGTSTLTNEKMQRVFTGKETFWKNGKTVVICLPGTKSAKAQEVFTKVYNKSIKEVQKFWLSLVFQGRAKSPNFFDAEQEMVDFVKRTPGAIGVLSSDKKGIVPSNLLITITN